MEKGPKQPDNLVSHDEQRLDNDDVERRGQSLQEKNDFLRVVTTESEQLPFSKARCVALVIAIAAAPFLNVSCTP
jgi:hypothetical protein